MRGYPIRFIVNKKIDCREVLHLRVITLVKDIRLVGAGRCITPAYQRALQILDLIVKGGGLETEPDQRRTILGNKIGVEDVYLPFQLLECGPLLGFRVLGDDANMYIEREQFRRAETSDLKQTPERGAEY